MVKVINISEINDELTFYRGQFDNYLIFIQLNKDFGHEPDNFIAYSSLIKYNPVSNSFDYYPIKATEISRNDVFPVLYYSFCNLNSNNSITIQFRKLNCIDLSDKEITSFPLDIKPDDSHDLSLWHSEIYGISERYAIAFIPSNSPEYGYPMFSKMLLLDSQENRYYDISVQVGKSDSLLRIKNIIISQDNYQTYMVLVTGRINWDEKEELWKHSQETYFDELQNLIIWDANTFIDDIIAGNEICVDHIIDSCNFENAFTFFEIDGKQLRYGKANFPDKTSEIISYDFVSKERLITKVDGVYSQISFSDNVIYGMERGELGAKVYDIINKKIIFVASANEFIEYFNNEYVFTRIWQGSNKYSFFLHYYNDNKFERLGEGRHCSFDKERELLMIFK